jgi:hypothetical protein
VEALEKWAAEGKLPSALINGKDEKVSVKGVSARRNSI